MPGRRSRVRRSSCIARSPRRTPLTSDAFDRWIALFQSTVDDLFSGPMAEHAKNSAARIAATMEHNIDPLTSSIDASSLRDRKELAPSRTIIDQRQSNDHEGGHHMNATMAPPVNVSPAPTTAPTARFDRSMSSDLARIRSEYIEMPGLVLTLAQAARLWGFGTPTCGRPLDCPGGRWFSFVRQKGDVPATAMTARDEKPPGGDGDLSPHVLSTSTARATRRRRPRRVDSDERCIGCRRRSV